MTLPDLPQANLVPKGTGIEPGGSTLPSPEPTVAPVEPTPIPVPAPMPTPSPTPPNLLDSPISQPIPSMSTQPSLKKYVPGQDLGKPAEVPPPPPASPTMASETTTNMVSTPKTDISGLVSAEQRAGIADQGVLQAETEAAKERGYATEGAVQVQEALGQEQAKAEQASQDRLKAMREAIDAKSAELEKLPVNQNKYWDIASTGDKIATGLNLLSALAYAFGNNPQASGKQVDKVLTDIDKTVQDDIASQTRKREIMKEALANKRIDYNTLQQWESSQIALGTAQNARKMETVNNRLKGILETKGIDAIAAAKLNQNIANRELAIEKLKADAMEKWNSQQKTETKTESKPVLTGLPAKELQAQYESTHKRIMDVNNNEMVKRFDNLAETKNGLEEAIKDPALRSLQISKFIAKTLEQGSYGVDLLKSITGQGTVDAAQDWLRRQVGQTGYVSEDLVQNMLKTVNNEISGISNSKTGSLLRAREIYEKQRAALEPAYNQTIGLKENTSTPQPNAGKITVLGSAAKPK